MATKRLLERTVTAARPTDKETYIWDADLPGFGLKVLPSGRKVFVVQYRPGGRGTPTRRVTVGVYGTITLTQARKKAGELLAEVELGGDPAGAKSRHRREATVAALCDRYLKEHVKAHNKASTAGEVERIVETRIKPHLGRLKVSDLTRARVKEWHQGMSKTPYEGNRALAYLSKLMSLAVREWEIRSDNPCQGVKRFPERKRERFFSDDELKQIGEALAQVEAASSELPGCVATIRLLALTGMRLGEVLGLRWSNVDEAAGTVRLPDAKAGARTVPLAAPALAVLRSLGRGKGCVVTGLDPAEPLPRWMVEKAWQRIRARASIPDGRLHDFRHTAGTFAAQAGMNAFLVRDFLGHRTLAMTGRYVERHADTVKGAAKIVSERVAAAMAGEAATVHDFPAEKAKRTRRAKRAGTSR